MARLLLRVPIPHPRPPPPPSVDLWIGKLISGLFFCLASMYICIWWAAAACKQKTEFKVSIRQLIWIPSPVASPPPPQSSSSSLESEDVGKSRGRLSVAGKGDGRWRLWKITFYLSRRLRIWLPLIKCRVHRHAVSPTQHLLLGINNCKFQGNSSGKGS